MSSVCLSVCRLSDTWVYCDKTAEDRIMQFPLKCISLSLCLASLMMKFEGSPLYLGVQTRVGRFSIDFATPYLGSAKYSLGDNSSLIGAVGFRLQQKSMTLNDLECQFTALSSMLCVLWPNGWGYDATLFLLWSIYNYISAIRILSLITKFKVIPFEFQA